MKNMFKIISLTLPLALFSCGSMAIDDYIENQGDLLPSDFNYREFAELNPDIALMQALSDIYNRNINWESDLKVAQPELTSAEINALKTADETEFLANQDLVEYFYLLSFKKEAVVDDMVSADLAQVKRFNLLGRNDELAFINDYLANKVDTNLVIDSYILYGINEGRAYRKCTAQDAKKTEKSPLLATERTSSSDPVLRYYTKYRFCAEIAADGSQTYYVIEP